MKKNIVLSKHIKYAFTFNNYISMKYWEWIAFLLKISMVQYGFNMLVIYGWDQT
jgi:hypothetical protein